MKKQRLQAEFEFEFDVIGIVSAYKDYKLAWNINNLLSVNLKREKDVKIKFIDNELVISHFKHTTENSDLQLLRNKSYELSGGENQYLIPEMKRFDYFLIIHGEVNEQGTDQIQTILKEIRGIEFVTRVEVENLRSKENFIF